MSDVSLTVPARAEYVRLLRLAAADCGARADLSIEDIEDLRIAVDELTYALMGDDPGDTRLQLVYAAAPGVVQIDGSCVSDGAALMLSDLSRTIIGGSVSEYEIAEDEGVRRFRLVKRTRGT